CNHGLSGEALDQFNLLLSKWTHLLPVDEDGADQVVVLEHRDDDLSSRAAELGRQADRSGFRGVGSVDDLFRAHGPIEQATWCRSGAQASPLSFGQFRWRPNFRDQVELAVESKQ